MFYACAIALILRQNNEASRKDIAISFHLLSFEIKKKMFVKNKK